MQTWATGTRINRHSYTTTDTRCISAGLQIADYCYEAFDTQEVRSHRDEVLYTFYTPRTEPLPAHIECDTEDLLDFLEAGGDDR